MATRTYSAIVGAGGTATITVRTDTVMPWTVAQISIEMINAPSGSTAELRHNDALVTPLIAAGDVAAGEPYVRLLSTDVLTIRWSGCTPGAIGKALVFYALDPRNA